MKPTCKIKFVLEYVKKVNILLVFLKTAAVGALAL